jgi:phosphate starvation-inducible protein PhoH and related proteins
MAAKTARKRKSTTVDNEIEESLKSNWILSDFKIKKPFHFNEKHKAFYDCIRDDNTNIAIVDGPAGTGKSYIGVLAALESLKDRKIKSIIYIRSIVESASRSIGALPGEVDDKFMPYAMPLIEKVREITDNSTCTLLQSNGVLCGIPVNFVRGLTFNDSIVIVDEIQNLTLEECTTILTRFGKNTKYILCGDSFQADIGKLTCISKIYNAFNTDESMLNNIHCFKFEETEIVRSKILKYIVKVLEKIPKII